MPSVEGGSLLVEAFGSEQSSVVEAVADWCGAACLFVQWLPYETQTLLASEQ
jgi:hypothetical protein